MAILESAENYLETIFILNQGDAPVRSIDVVKELGYSKPSVSVAMKNLRSKGYVSISSAGYITLTDSGRDIAQSMHARHTLISDWLTYLGVDRDTAERDACKMEHGISEKSFIAIQNHIDEWKRNQSVM